ncbi:MAG TPA: VOC family protein [Propionibacteriaceae bacterium]|nr:VOC family protein [Propionibacteriaceae bacterium]
MERMIFLNLPVSDLATATSFYTGLGFSVNEMFSDDQVTSIVISDTIVVMLLAKKRFADFVTGAVGDPAEATSALYCLSAQSPQEVDELVQKALASGGKPWKDLMKEGPMYGHSFADPDGHVWEVLHMDMSQLGDQPS